MPPKKNRFSCFMDDLKKKASIEGRHFKNMAELVAYAGPLWNKLDEYEKNKYQLKAKSTSKNETADLLNYERSKQEEEIIMNATIKQIITELDQNGLMNKKFYLCHVNYLYGSGETFMPCEIGLIEFSLIKGIRKSIHFFVYGPDIPKGYYAKVIDHSDRYHSIPVDLCTTKPINHYEILTAITKFIDPENLGYFPPIYSMPDNYNMNFSMSAVKSSLTLFSKAGNIRSGIFRVYSLTSLFNEIIKAANVKIGLPENTFLCEPEREIVRDRFVTFQNIACDFHHKIDLGIKCSLSIVTRWAYTVIATYSNITGIELNMGNDNKSRDDWKNLLSCPYRSMLVNAVNKKPIIQTSINYETDEASGESQLFQEEQLPEPNSDIRAPHPRTLTAVYNMCSDIGKLTITRGRSHPAWPKYLFRNEK